MTSLKEISLRPKVLLHAGSGDQLTNDVLPVLLGRVVVEADAVDLGHRSARDAVLSRVLPVLAQNMVTVMLVVGSVQTLKDLDAKIWEFVSDGLGPRVDEGPLRDAGGDSRLPDLLPAEVGVVLAKRLGRKDLFELLKVGEYLRHLIAEVVIWQYEHARFEADELAILLAGNVGVLRQQIVPGALRVAAVRAQSVIKQVDLQLVGGSPTGRVAWFNWREWDGVREGGYRRHHHRLHLLL